MSLRIYIGRLYAEGSNTRKQHFGVIQITLSMILVFYRRIEMDNQYLFIHLLESQISDKVTLLIKTVFSCISLPMANTLLTTILKDARIGTI